MEKRVYSLIIIYFIFIIFCLIYIFAQSGEVGITIDNFFINISGPLNTTYYSNITTDNVYSITLNVSSNRNIVLWKYSLFGNGVLTYENISFSSPVIINATRGTNKVIVYALDDYDNYKENSVSFTLDVTNKAPLIQSINERIYVCENKSLPGGGFPIPRFNITEPDSQDIEVRGDDSMGYFDVGIVSQVNSTTSVYEIFSGVLGDYVSILDIKDLLGGVNIGWINYSLGVSVIDDDPVDPKSDSSIFNITLIEINNAPKINNIGVKTLNTNGENSTFDYEVKVFDTEDKDSASGNLDFNVSFSNETLFDIDNYGMIDFTANESYTGVHNVKVCCIDNGLSKIHPLIQTYCGQTGGSLYSCQDFSITITDDNRVPEILGYYPTLLSFTTDYTNLLYFNISVYDEDGTIPDVYWYLNNELIEYDSGTESGSLNQNFSYSFPCGVGGNYIVRADVTDGISNASMGWSITLNYIACSGSAPIGNGGGGGGGKAACIPRWACKDYNDCKNLNEAIIKGNNIFGLINNMREECVKSSWNEANCGYQTRECKDVNNCNSNKTAEGIARGCYFTINPSCHDNILNCHNGSCEVLVDCGGSCKPCPTCSDRIKNQGETGVDCGGPCPECIIEEPFLQFDPMTIIIPSLIILIMLGLIILIILFIGFIRKRKYVDEINQPRKEI